MFLRFIRKLILLSLLTLVIVYCSPIALKYYANLEGPLLEEINFGIDKNQSLTSISGKLKKYGVIRSKILFLSYIKLKGYEKRIRFGEYLLPRRINLENLLDLFSSGKQINYSITIPEGWSSWKVVKFLNSNKYLSGEVESLPVEGSLSPDTYFVAKGENRNKVLGRMQLRQEEVLRKIWNDRDSDLPLNSPRDLLILASIIEKETGISAERRIIASVLINRITKGMRLQVDPTVIYGLTKGKGKLGRPLISTDLKTASDYNTYLLSGLPKGPICNPGKDSILAASKPEKTNFLYFVADGEGGHVFSENLSEHNKNVKRWKERLN